MDIYFFVGMFFSLGYHSLESRPLCKIPRFEAKGIIMVWWLFEVALISRGLIFAVFVGLAILHVHEIAL